MNGTGSRQEIRCNHIGVKQADTKDLQNIFSRPKLVLKNDVRKMYTKLYNQEFIEASQWENIGPQDVRRMPPPTSPGRPLEILFDRPADVAIWRPGDILKWRPADVLIWRSRDVPGTLIRDVS